MIKNQQILRPLYFIIVFIVLAVAVYFASLQPLEGNLPTSNMPELGNPDRDVMIYKTYDHFVSSEYFLYALPVLSTIFTILFTRKKTLWKVLGGVIFALALWIGFWEIFFHIKGNVFVLQYYKEGFYSSQSLFFDGLGSWFFLPLMTVATFVVSVIIRVGENRIWIFPLPPKRKLT